MHYPKKLAFPTATRSFSPFVLEKQYEDKLAARAGMYAVYYNTNCRAHGYAANASTYVAIGDRIYGPYFIGKVKEKGKEIAVDQVRELIFELNTMLNRGETVRRLPGPKVEWCKVDDGEVLVA